MDKGKVIEHMRNSGCIGNVEEIEYKPDYLVLRFFYDFDDDEIEAAKDYANNESGEDSDEDTWYGEYYSPYLTDLAVDEVRDIIEELVENQDYNAEYISYELDKDDESMEFIAVFTDSDKEFEIDDVLDSLNL